MRWGPLMQDGDLGRQIVPVQQLGPGPGPVNPNTEIVFARLSNAEHTTKPPSIDYSVSKDMQSRKIGPELPATSHLLVFAPPTTVQPKAGRGLFHRIATFFGLGDQKTAPETSPIRFVARPDAEPTVNPETKPGDVEKAMDRFEQSQKFAVGMALASSLTQSVMSSARRLTQGQ